MQNIRKISQKLIHSESSYVSEAGLKHHGQSQVGATVSVAL